MYQTQLLLLPPWEIFQEQGCLLVPAGAGHFLVLLGDAAREWAPEAALPAISPCRAVVCTVEESPSFLGGSKLADAFPGQS